MNLRAKVWLYRSRNRATPKGTDGTDYTIPRIAMFLTELLVLKVSTKRKKWNLQQLLVAFQH